MITALLGIIKILLGCGLAGILIIIGAIAVVTHIIKAIVVRIYFAIHASKHSKGGDDK